MCTFCEVHVEICTICISELCIRIVTASESHILHCGYANDRLIDSNLTKSYHYGHYFFYLFLSYTAWLFLLFLCLRLLVVKTVNISKSKAPVPIPYFKTLAYPIYAGFSLVLLIKPHSQNEPRNTSLASVFSCLSGNFPQKVMLQPKFCLRLYNVHCEIAE